MIVTNTNSTWPSRTSIIPGPRQRARKPTASSSACIRQCSTSSIASPSARRSIRPSPTCRPTLTPGWSNTTNSGPTWADTASAKHHFKPSLTPSQSPRKNPSSISRLNSLQPHDRRPASSCRPSDQVQTFTPDIVTMERVAPSAICQEADRKAVTHFVAILERNRPTDASVIERSIYALNIARRHCLYGWNDTASERYEWLERRLDEHK